MSDIIKLNDKNIIEDNIASGVSEDNDMTVNPHDWTYTINKLLGKYKEKFPNEYIGKLQVDVMNAAWVLSDHNTAWFMGRLCLIKNRDILYRTGATTFQYIDFDEAPKTSIRFIKENGIPEKEYFMRVKE